MALRGDRGLQVLVQACNEALGDARAGGTWLANMVPQLERLCVTLQGELDASSS